ncbi:cyanoexosortase A [Leptodesmis sp.]|uniref:cyanoexosortase A n=1 Tax=Leptodesmis sp. TaxID=3100501 RepID=UPI0040534E9D
MELSKRLQEPKFWLLAIVAAIAALHLTLLSRLDDSDIFATAILFWVAAGSLVWDKHDALMLESKPLPTVLGLLLLVFILLRTALSGDSVSSAWVIPLLSALGVGLMASGFKGLKQYWKELVIFGLLAIYPFLKLLLQIIDLSEITAKAANVMLWYVGFNVQRQGVFLILPTSRVEVYGACSGLQSILQMLAISVLFLLMFPIRSHVKKLLCVVIAVLIGFFVNAIRVALMVILNNAGNKSAFDYWHEGNGSLVFAAISVFIFGCFCWLTFLRQPPQTPDSGAKGNA